VAVDDVSGVARLSRRPAQGHQLRELPRPLRPPHPRDGRARVRAGGDGGRPSRDGARAPRRDPRRRDGLHDLALADPRNARWPAGRQPAGDVGRGPAARRRDGRDERRDLRVGRRGRRPRARRSRRLPRLSRAPARSRGRDRTAHHVGHVQPPGGARGVAPLHGPARRDRGRGRADVRPGAQPRAQRRAVVQEPAAVRPPPGVEAVPRAAAGRAARAPARPRDAPPAHRGRPRNARPPGPRDRGAAVPLRVDLPLRRRCGPAPHASAVSIRPRR